MPVLDNSGCMWISSSRERINTTIDYIAIIRRILMLEYLSKRAILFLKHLNLFSHITKVAGQVVAKLHNCFQFLPAFEKDSKNRTNMEGQGIVLDQLARSSIEIRRC
ncbi:unnamed protein product [Heligmosomoides polygyrus]|uniref:Ovule protein n=1 Tax=Heligmosomoides polygyrus TaxID=6339 RepID=A0A183F8C4_HELPZ|nr:unnamed protein product [Heligmosomoides polygyrus]